MSVACSPGTGCNSWRRTLTSSTLNRRGLLAIADDQTGIVNAGNAIPEKTARFSAEAWNHVCRCELFNHDYCESVRRY